MKQGTFIHGQYNRQYVNGRYRINIKMTKCDGDKGKKGVWGLVKGTGDNTNIHLGFVGIVNKIVKEENKEM